MQPTPEAMIGVTLEGRYQIVRLMGRGGMATVYEGFHLRLRTRVAIKILDRHLAKREIQRKRFIREAQSASLIQSDHVIKVLDYGEQPVAFFVMEFLEGEDLSDVLEREGRLDWAHTRTILLQVLAALRAAHAEGIIHRDMKPSNVFLQRRPDGSTFVKVLDFGIAKVAEPTKTMQGLTGTDEVLGTLDYMAPEQAMAEGVDPRSDIYAVGIMAYEMLSGELPFPGKTAYEIIERHIREQARPLSEWVPSLPKTVEDLVFCAIEKKPEDRYQGTDEFEAAILRVLPNGRMVTSPSSSRMIAAVSLLTGLMMISVVAAWYLHLGPFGGS